MSIGTLILLIVTIIALITSFINDKEKTIKSLLISKVQFLNTVSEILGILALIGLFLAIVPENVIKTVLGGSSISLSTIYGAIIGTITIIPAFVAFPLSASLVKSGSHLIAISAFITTLTMVGFATMPVEFKYFGKRFTLVRNILSFIFALIIALGMGVIL